VPDYRDSEFSYVGLREFCWRWKCLKMNESCPMTGFDNGWWHLKSTTRSSNIQPQPPHLSHDSSLTGSLSHVTQS
jgi:hypothetical protein